MRGLARPGQVLGLRPTRQCICGMVGTGKCPLRGPLWIAVLLIHHTLRRGHLRSGQRRSLLPVYSSFEEGERAGGVAEDFISV